MTWPESVDEALCFGWIDGVRRRIDGESYSIRFTPRRARSTWSAVNLRRVPELVAAGRMTPAGLAAYEARREDNSRIYSYEQEDGGRDPEHLRRLQEHPEAWAFFSAQAPWYQRSAGHWVSSAKREETRERRLARLVEASAAGRRLQGA
jgi:uncharacterized protein YdeI (YjbR/CyaY-like superfamily)